MNNKAILASPAPTLLPELLRHLKSHHIFSMDALLCLIITLLLNRWQLMHPLNYFLLIELLDLISEFLGESLEFLGFVEYAIVLFFLLGLRIDCLPVLRSIHEVQAAHTYH